MVEPFPNCQHSWQIKIHLKRELIADGWKLENYQGPEITQKSEIQDIKFDTFNTRYTLFGSWRLGSGASENNSIAFVVFNISIVDNISRSEALVYEGRGPIKEVVNRLLEELNQ